MPVFDDEFIASLERRSVRQALVMIARSLNVLLEAILRDAQRRDEELAQQGTRLDLVESDQESYAAELSLLGTLPR